MLIFASLLMTCKSLYPNLWWLSSGHLELNSHFAQDLANKIANGWINKLLVPSNTRISSLLVTLKDYQTSQGTSQSKKEKGARMLVHWRVMYVHHVLWLPMSATSHYALCTLFKSWWCFQTDCRIRRHHDCVFYIIRRVEVKYIAITNFVLQGYG